MLIKMQRSKAHTDYLIYDNVTNVNYHSKPVQKPEFGTTSVTHDWFWYSDPNTNRPTLNKISFNDSNGAPINLWFDGEAYICNDEGKTIQKVSAIPDGDSVPR